ncbi:MAG: 2-oxo acid dehydrogenase subunit E2 [Pseudomonadota bacterium]|nr:2-oxo acid dehydrogenase subunit E2 [Pseudomonadota bacterium]
MKTFKLPDLGEGLAEAEIVQWHVRPGDAVQADQPLVAVETAKAIVDIPAPYAGKVARLFGNAGDIVHTGAPLVGFAGDEADSGTVVGGLESGKTTVADHPLGVARTGGGIKAAPAVRALAQRLGVDLGVVTPSGPDGLITSADVQRVARILAEAGPLELLRGVRRAMAHNMTQAHAEVVPVTLVDEADIDAWPAASDVTLRLIRALVAGCRAEPALNAWYDSHAVGRRVLRDVHLGIAVDTADGLFVAVLREADKRPAAALRAELNELKTALAARQIAPERLRGYTITLSNFGMIAGRHATPVVMPPTVAILGAGRARPQVVAADGAPAVHRVLPLSLTFDHRAVTGGEAGRFLAAVLNDLEQPD